MAAIDKAKNSAQRVKGKVEELIGKMTGDDRLRIKGKAHQMTGNLKRAGEKVRDAF